MKNCKMRNLFLVMSASLISVFFFLLGILGAVAEKNTFVIGEVSYITGRVVPDKVTVHVTDCVSDFKDGEMRAVWAASVYNLNYPSKPGLSSDELRKEADLLLEKMARAGLNTVFFQVRPTSDALYRSKIFPSSHFLVKNQGDPIDFDPLEYLSEKCRERSFALYAWINPFRITVSPMNYNELCSENPALSGEYTVYECGGNYYYDPGEPSTRNLIINGVLEICKGYCIDGIVFDDYFYAEGIDDEDIDTYKKYGEGMSLEDFRRESVNRTVREVYSSIKEYSEDISFCVSVRGIWQNKSEDPHGSETSGGSAYSEIYCDALAFIEGGYADIISPQIYWPFDSARAPFAHLADWWERAVCEKGKGKVKLAVSLASYYLSDGEIEKQKEYIKKAECYKGFALYNASCLDCP